MPPFDRCLASMASLTLTQGARPAAQVIPRFLAPALIQSRQASVVRINNNSNKKKKKARAAPKDYKRHNLQKRGMLPQYSLVDAMRVLRAWEVGQPSSCKYEMHITLKTLRSGPVIKSSVRLPYPVQSDWRIAVICPEGSDIAAAASAAGAVAVGEESLFEAIRAEKIEFDRLICHESSEKALGKANLGKILGPKGLMPNRRMKTIVTDVAKSIKDSAGAADYRERVGVIHMAIGQLNFSAEQLKANIETVMKKIKSEAAEIAEESPKDIHEIVLSTTRGPALSLNGKLNELGAELTEKDVSTVM